MRTWSQALWTLRCEVLLGDGKFSTLLTEVGKQHNVNDLTCAYSSLVSFVNPNAQESDQILLAIVTSSLNNAVLKEEVMIMHMLVFVFKHHHPSFLCI